MQAIVNNSIYILRKTKKGFFVEFSWIRSQEMIIHYIYKCPGIQTISRPKNLFCFFGGNVCVSKYVNIPVQGNPFLNSRRVVKFLFSLYKITDKITDQYFRVLKRKICVGQVVDVSFG